VKEEILWKEYLSHKPTDIDLTMLIVYEKEGFLKNKAFEELKKRKILKRDDLLSAILYSESLRQEAWELLCKMGPENYDLERIIGSRIDASDPVKQAAKKMLGRGKEEILSEIRDLV